MINDFRHSTSPKTQSYPSPGHDVVGTPRAAYLQYRDEDRGTGAVRAVAVTNHSTGRSCFTAASGQCPRLEWHGKAFLGRRIE